MRLCGSDTDDQTSVLEAGLGWIVGWKKTISSARRGCAQKAALRAAP
jgi:glycine cleavage system aminomethyltransferase T